MERRRGGRDARLRARRARRQSLLGVATILTGLRAQLKGSVKFIFQPAEEMPPEGEEGGALVELPAAIIRLQRREWFRAALPVQPPIRCTVLDPDGNASPAQAIDLSCGGTSLVVDDPSLAGSRPGSDHELILSLPEVGRVELGATLRTVRSSAGTPGVPPTKMRLGFRFEKVPPKTVSQIQRYVQHLEVTQLRVLRRRRRRTGPV